MSTYRSNRKNRKLSKRQWAIIRWRVLKRDGWRCRQCEKWGNEVDHVKPLAAGGDDSLDNLQVLCTGCHIEKTRQENRRETPQQGAWRRLVEDML